jgi:hypothetical protein
VAATDLIALSSLECPQILGHVWIPGRQCFDIADFDVDFFYAGPILCSRRETSAVVR